MLHRASFICFCYIDIKFQEFSLVYMCAWLYVCGCMYMIHHVYMNMFMLCMCMCMCVWRSENNPSCPSSDVSSIFCLRQGFLLARNFIKYSSPASQPASRSVPVFTSGPCHPWDYSACLRAWLFMCILGTLTQTGMLSIKVKLKFFLYYF